MGRHRQHRWSGWPGAWCLDCGLEDQLELALADGVYCPVENKWSDPKRKEEAIRLMAECPEPGSKKHDPYANLTAGRKDVNNA